VPPAQEPLLTEDVAHGIWSLQGWIDPILTALEEFGY
jgi:hypothetical protein